MDKQLRYMGEFLSRAGVVWRTEILQEADEAFAAIGALSFPADEPLSIEWERTDKEEPICGSTATLKIISPGDRTYEDLYTIEPGRIRLDVYRDGALYWSGLLDPEFYEEPYERFDGYEVSLTFSDFGILDRLKYDLTGIRTLREITLYALSRAGIQYNGLDTTLISTQLMDGKTIAGGGLSVRSENFIDEDGEASTLYEALEGILQPLAARMVQRAGKIYIYDLNGLYSAGTAQPITWDGDSQTMGTDKVANNVKVTFSPYSSAELQSGEIEYKGEYDVTAVNLTTGSKDDQYGEYYSFHPDYGSIFTSRTDFGNDTVDFTIFIGDKGTGVKSIGSKCRYFHILPVVGGGSETSGVAYYFRVGHRRIKDGGTVGKVNNYVANTTDSGFDEILTTNRVFIPKLSDTDAKKFKLRITEEILIDARYNPFSGSTDNNEEDNDDKLKAYSGFVFIPVAINLYDAEGNQIYYYDNYETAYDKGTAGHLSSSKGKWVAGEQPSSSYPRAWLEYYNPDDPKDDAGIRGWKGNRHCIGRPDGRSNRPTWQMYDSFKKMADGEYLPYPPEAGYLEIRIFAGIEGHDYDNEKDSYFLWGGGSYKTAWEWREIYDKLRWCLYKAPKVELVRNNLVLDEAELEDVEYTGYINKAAKEEISIDTICGTSDTICPTAKGIFHRTSDGLQIQTLVRRGRIDHPEKLLIGTLCSQYADRKTTLSGEAQINGGLHYYTERNQDGKRFMLMSDVQDVIADTTEAEYCEFRPDEYDSIEEVES